MSSERQAKAISGGACIVGVGVCQRVERGKRVNNVALRNLRLISFAHDARVKSPTHVYTQQGTSQVRHTSL